MPRPVRYARSLQVRFEADDVARIERAAERLGVSRTELIRTLTMTALYRAEAGVPPFRRWQAAERLREEQLVETPAGAAQLVESVGVFQTTPPEVTRG